MNWKPSSSIDILRLRAQMLTEIRGFFSEKNILEVETPILCQHTVTDTHIESFPVEYRKGHSTQIYYLQTSPEYAMKRLLAAGSGAIFQIVKAFRHDDLGRFHNPEFSMVEWYRPGFDDHQLMNEVDEFLQKILKLPQAKRTTYRNLFKQFIHLDLNLCTNEDLKQVLRKEVHSVEEELIRTLDRDTCLQLLMSHYIEPKLGFSEPIFVYDFPVNQAALAKVRSGSFPVAERFEVYIQGMEIANGFHELTDVSEQHSRFIRDQKERKIHNKPIPKIDTHFIDALRHGLPECSGVALGMDRLMMIKAKAEKISDVISFSWDRA